MDRSDLKVGIIGLGGIARVAHLPGYREAGVQVAAVCTPRREVAEVTARDVGAAFWTTDYRELLARPDLDAVSVCVPTYLHAPVTVAALQAGKHVFCEKPPALNAAEAKAMADAAEKAGKLLIYAFSARFRRSNLRLKEWCEKGHLGRIYAARAGWMRRRGNPAGWFSQKALAGGGPLIDLGIHALDLTWWLMGKPAPAAVSGATYREFGNYQSADAITADPVMQIHQREKKREAYDVEDSAFGFVRFAGGEHLWLETAWALNCEKEDRYVILYGTKAGARINPLRLFGDLDGTLVDMAPEVPDNNAYLEEVRHFVACLEGKETPIAPASDGVAVMQMVDALYRSAETGREAVIADA